MSEIGGVWRTIGGRRVFIKDGQDLVSAMKESRKFKKNNFFSDNRTNTIINQKDLEVDKIVSTIKLSKKEHSACNEIFEEFKKNNNENLILIDKNSFVKKGNITTSNEHSTVGFSNEQVEIMNASDDRSLIAIHNHPGNGTFSIKDIYTCYEYDKIGGIMVVTEEYVYSLKPDFNKSTLNMNKGYDIEFETKLGDVNDELLGKYPMFSNNQLYHMAFKKIFDEMGWEYGREKRNKN